MNTLCPRCLQLIAGFKPFVAPDGKTRTLECPMCSHRDIPLRYAEQYTRFPPLPVSIMGCTAHGKSRYLDALYRELRLVGRDYWKKDYAPDDLDVFGFRRMQQRLEVYDQGEAGNFTQADFPEPQIIRLHNVPRVGNCQLIIFDTAGEIFQQPEKIREQGKYLGKSNAIVWLASLRERPDMGQPFEWVPDGQFLEVFTAYMEAMAQDNARTEAQSLIFTVTKGERLLSIEGVPASIRAAMEENLSDDTVMDPWWRLEKLSNDLREWLSNCGYYNLIHLLEQRFRTVRFCVVSAQGKEIDDPTDIPFHPKAVLAPIYWLWRLERPGLWLQSAGRLPRRYFSLASAIEDAAPASHIMLDEGKFVLERQLEIRKPLRISGKGRRLTFISGVGREFLVGVAVKGTVILENCTFDGSLMINGDVLKAVQGLVTLDGCRFRAARSDDTVKFGGCGIRIIENAQLTATNCEFHKNARSGVYISAREQASLSKCRMIENKIGLNIDNSARVNTIENVCTKNGAGIVVSGYAHLIAERDDCSENSAAGIIVRDNAQFRGENLKIIANSGHGVMLESRAGAQMTGWKVEGNQHGIAASGNSIVTLDESTIVDNRGNGVQFADATEGRCTKSRFMNNQAAGLRLAQSAAVIANDCLGQGNHEADLIIEKTVNSAIKISGFHSVVDKRRRTWF